MWIFLLRHLIRIVTQQRKLVDYKPEMCSIIEAQLMHLRVLLGVILSSAEGILSELLEAHRRVSLSLV